MNYDIQVDDYDGKKIETVEGENVDVVLKRAFYLQTRNQFFTDAEKNSIRRELANTTTKNIQSNINKQSNLLKKSLGKEIRVNWNSLADNFKRNNPEPKPPKSLSNPYSGKIPPIPDKDDDKYKPNLTFRDKFSSHTRMNKIFEAKKLYKKDYKEWEASKNRIEEENSQIKAEHKLKLEQQQNDYNKRLYESKKALDKIMLDQRKNEIDYQNGGADGIGKYFEILLLSSEYESDFFDRKIFTRYFTDNKLLFVEYNLPDKKDLTNIKEVKYVMAKKEYQEVYFSETQMNKKYDDVLYQITLRSLNEIFSAETEKVVDQVVFNGVVDTIDSSTGQDIRPCVISISVSKDTFRNINFNKVVPKDCFRGLKGVSASKLSTLSPVTPVMQIDKEDKRFVDSYSVTSDMDSQTNLAAMDWEDFEHLIRELFEKEFSQGGGEVKVTQASRDGGVDAIAFDPDPIRGGKIVIQAKRYTNVVGVSAVRDLYGTLMNEGATKGILVTTADYGADAYEFARGKPLTLLSGSNLLSLLEKHGHKAKIDLKEAKMILAEKEREN